MEIKVLLEKLPFEVKNKSLFYDAFTHSSFNNENSYKGNYKKLELLGDSIIDFLVADYIYPNAEDEGKMSLLRSHVVNKELLGKFLIQEKLQNYIRFGNSINEPDINSKTMSDVFEAFVAAIYLDQGIETTREFLKRNIFKEIDLSKDKDLRNPKTKLQEYLQLESRDAIKYIDSEFEDGYKSEVFHEGNKFGEGYGKSKKEAQVNAANDALRKVGINDETN